MAAIAIEYGVNVLDYPPEVQDEMISIIAEQDEKRRRDELRRLAQGGR